MIRLVIIDRNVLFRECIIAVLKSSHGLKVVGSLNSMEKVSSPVGSNSNVIALSADDDIYSTVKSINKARRLFPRIPLLLYGRNSSDKFKNQVTNQGVLSYIDTNHTPSDFIKLIKRTAGSKGGKSLNANKNVAGNYKALQTPKDKLTRLSFRELMVLKMIASGKSVRDISSELSLKISTVHTFRTRLMNKLKLKNNVEIALFAINNKMVSSPEYSV